MISVTDLTSYMYCPRKLYFRKVLKIKEGHKPVTIRGLIKHRVFEESGKQDREIATSFTASDSLESLEMRFRRVYYRALMDSIQSQKKELKNLKIHPLNLYKEIWPFFFNEAKAKSSYFYSLAKEKNVYGAALWLALPKSVPELRIKSEKLGLIGVVDVVDVDNGHIPIEIKTGVAPREGVWRENKIQVAAYMLLLSEHYGKDITEGYVEYRSVNERRHVVMNPFLKDEIFDLIRRVSTLLGSEILPEKVTDEKKCNNCGIKSQCFSRD